MVCTVCYLGNQVTENEIGGVGSTHEGDKGIYEIS